MLASSGPPLMVFVLIVNIDKDEWRGTTYAFTVLAELARISAFMSLVDAPKLQLAPGLWLQVVFMLLGGVFGLCIGNFLSTRMSQENFRHSLLCILLMGGLTLSTSGLGKFSIATSLIASLVGSGAYARYHLHASKH